MDHQIDGNAEEIGDIARIIDRQIALAFDGYELYLCAVYGADKA